MSKKWIIILAISLFHLCLWIVLFLSTFGMSMERFETGLEPPAIYHWLNALLDLLSLPLSSSPLNKLFIGWTGWILLSANSLIWGIGLRSLAAILFNKLNPPKP